MSSIAKRAFDLIVAALGLLVLSPLLAIIAALVSMTSAGGPFFRQTRIGRHRRPFKILKFRTMTVRPDAADGSFDAGDRCRVTRVGRILRRTKIDELPQLWNVLTGDMSLVGPRPEVPEWTKVYPEQWEIVLSVRPGITDPASIAFRDEESVLASAPDPTKCYRNEILPRKLAVAAEYAVDHTLLGDISIILRTGLAVLRPARSKSSAREWTG
ncbi:MAG: sugar transferase [Phycisphaerales bacterium]|jgi:lipopolysaccharide/colanic/teichoic acid biosynthesis glycosyltransferase|nr:sugar transferase [Phycisphaerales bacterium]